MNIQVVKLGSGFIECTFEASGTRYNLIVGHHADGTVFVAWPDLKWSFGHFSRHAAPAGGYLRSQGIKSKVDADNIALCLGGVWDDVVAGSRA